jgi:uncharacterized membrane protein
MTLKMLELVSIVLSAFVAGMFYGPWVALSRSLSMFEPEIFLAIVHRLNRNMAPVMTILMPAALLSIVPVLFVSYKERPGTFSLTLAGFALYIIALVVTVVVEVPIVKRFEGWTVSTLPSDWEQIRDRWEAFHVVRIVAAVVGSVLIVAGAIF